LNPAVQAPGALVADAKAGVVVFLVALPLCLGIALASNAPLFSGLLSGIIGGIVVGLVSRSHTSVSGPAAGLTAVVAAQIAALGSFEAFLLAVFLAGVLQVILGVIRAGSIADFVPASVIKGLLAAIGLILILKQIPHLVGHDEAALGLMSFREPEQRNTFTALGHALLAIHPGATLIGALSVVILIIWDRVKWLKNSLLPGPLVVVVLGVLMTSLLEGLGGTWLIETSHLVQVPEAAGVKAFVGFLTFPDFSNLAMPGVYVAAVTIALVASLETLLNLEAVDKLDPHKRVSPTNRELVAQGVGNMTAGMIGGLPVTSVIVRSSVNINTGARSKRSAVLHGVLLLLSVALLPGWLNRIPLASLAAILIMTGLKLAAPKLFRQLWKEGLNQFIPFVVTVGAILLTDLLVGILIGLGFSIVFILRSNLNRPLRQIREKHIAGEVLRIELANQVSFLNRVALSKALASVPANGHVLLDARHTDYIDADVMALITEYQQEIAPVRGVQVSLSGFQDHYEQLEDRVEYVDFSTREVQESITPEQVMEVLREGNERFRSGRPLVRDFARQREVTALHQHPLAIVLSGASSRTPVEMIFDAGLGDIFCARVTGNWISEGVLGTLEYACAVAGAKLVVTMGHSNSAMVRMAMQAQREGRDAAHITGHAAVDRILAEFQKSIRPEGLKGWLELTPEEREAGIDEVYRRHVLRTNEIILARSPSLRGLTEQGRLKLVGAMYNVRTGQVNFVD
jgi:carbonic anhydrase/SulP family sulfate permease